MGDETGAVQAALNGGSHTRLAAGVYPVAGLAVPPGAVLQLDPGAVLLTSGPVDVGDGSQLLGAALFAPNSPPPFGANVVWAGPPGGTVLRAGVAGNPGGVRVRGITVDGNGVAGVTGCRVGSWDDRNSLVWSDFRDLSLCRVENGLDVQSAQEITFRRLTCYNPDFGQTAPPPAGFGLRLGATPGVVAGVEIDHLRTTNFTTHVQVGDRANPAALGVFRLTVRDGYLVGLPADGGCAIDLARGNVLRFRDLTADGPVATDAGHGSTRLVKVGGPLTSANHVLIEGCVLAGADVLVEGFAWQYLHARDCYLVPAAGAAAVACSFLNSGGGPVRRYGHWGPNYQVAGDEFAGGFAGFDSFALMGLDTAVSGNRSQPAVRPGLTSDPAVLNPGGSARLVPDGLRCLVDVVDNLGRYGRVYVPGDGTPPSVLADPYRVFGTDPAWVGWAVYFAGHYLIANNNGQPLNVGLTTTAV